MPLHYEESVKNGMEVVQQCASWFFDTNRSHYLAQAFERCDIEGHLHAEVLMRYLDLIERHPGYYATSSKKDEMAAFRASLYQSCRNACFAHHRMHIRSLKRGLNLRNGMVHLDHADINADGVLASESLMVSSRPDMAPMFKPVADSLHRSGEITAGRLWCLLWHENKPATAILLNELGDDRDSTLQTIKSQALAFLPETSAEITQTRQMDPLQKERFRQAALKAKLTNQISIVAQPESPTRARLMSAIAQMDDAQAADVLKVIEGGQATAFPKAVRKETIKENARKWLVIDHEIISDVLSIEINPEMSPLVVKRVIASAMASLTAAEKSDLPEIVEEFITSLNEVFPGEAVMSSDPELIDGELVITPKIGPAAFMSRVQKLQRWASWIDGNAVEMWQSGNEVRLRAEVLQHFTTETIGVVLSSFESVD